LRQSKGAEEADAGFSSMIKPQAGDLAGDGVDLVVVVAVDFIAQDAADFFQVGKLFQGAGTDNTILEPAIGAFDLALGLRGEGIGDIHT
jgi:hypothetical protein